MKKASYIILGVLMFFGFVYFFNFSLYLLRKSDFIPYLKKLGNLGDILFVIFIIFFILIGGILLLTVAKFLVSAIIWKKSDGSILKAFKFWKTFDG